ncbi:MAG: FAD-binding protein [Gracilibacteraceae bacterium]|jgi:electron transfer flavoprotein alpha subunit|nr:FAD-binding protein [Gracilibacteraceae bacterium]
MAEHESWLIVADERSAATLAAMAAKLGGKMTAVAVGSRPVAEAAALAGADSVIWYPADEQTPAEAWAKAVAAAALIRQPRVLLAANLPAAKVLLGAAAANLGADIVSSVAGLAWEDGRLTVTRAVADSRAVEKFSVKGALAGLIREGSEEAERRTVPVAVVPQTGTPDRLKITATHPETGAVNLASADRVVGVGVGIGGKENLALINGLAAALRAEVACSLPLCDDFRWFEHSRVVGSSTQRITPRLYLAVGVSGQPQHMRGVDGAKVIVAVNNDPEAAIFKKCNLGIIGDLHKIVPVLTAELAKYANQ